MHESMEAMICGAPSAVSRRLLTPSFGSSLPVAGTQGKELKEADSGIGNPVWVRSDELSMGQV